MFPLWHNFGAGTVHEPLIALLSALSTDPVIERDETNRRVPDKDPDAATDLEVTRQTLDAQRAAFVRLVDNGRGGFDLSLLIAVTL